MSGAIPTLPQYAFMAWCSVKAQGQLYIYLYLYTPLGRCVYLKKCTVISSCFLSSLVLTNFWRMKSWNYNRIVGYWSSVHLVFKQMLHGSVFRYFQLCNIHGDIPWTVTSLSITHFITGRLTDVHYLEPHKQLQHVFTLSDSNPQNTFKSWKK
jgi:hypothetical protein